MNNIKHEVTDIIEQCVTSDRLHGVMALLNYLEPYGYFDAPASSAHHHSCEGGLAAHSLDVCKTLLSMAYVYECRYDYILNDESCVIVALFHDCHKVTDGFGRICYDENVLKSGKISEAKPYVTVKDYSPHAGGRKSTLLVSKFVALLEDEMQAIETHDGQYVSENRYVQHKEYPLTLALHHADMLSTAFDKGVRENNCKPFGCKYEPKSKRGEEGKT